jgi:hypothetical protein
VSVQNCIADLKSELKSQGKEGTVSEERLRALAVQLESLQRQGLTRAQYMAKIQEMFQTQMPERAQAAKVSKLQELQSVMQAAKIVTDERNGKDWVQNLQDYIEGGGIRAGQASNMDPRIMSGVLAEKFYKMFRKMTFPYKALIESGLGTKDIYHELHNLQTGGLDMVSGNKDAFEIAKSIHTIQEALFRMKRAFNPLLEKSGEFLTHRTHDQEKILAAGPDVWVKSMLDNFGEKSFPQATLAQKEVLFRDMYNRIQEGVYGTASDRSRLTSDLMRKMAVSRELVANSWEHAYNYNEQFGDGNIMTTLHKFISRGAEDVAQLQKFGPNKREFLDKLVGTLKRVSDEEGLKRFDAKQSSINNSYRVATGVANAPAMGSSARAARAALTMSYLSHAGGALLSSLSDIAISAGLLRGLNGATVIGNFAQLAGKYVHFMASSAEREKTMETSGVFSHTMHRELMNMAGGAEQNPGAIYRAAQLFGKMTLIERHMNAVKAAIGEAMSNHLGQLAQVEHAGLTGQTKNFLMRYGINESEWNAIREVGHTRDTNVPGSEGWKYPVIDAERIESLPDATIDKYLAQSGRLPEGATPTANIRERARYELSTKYGTMLNEIASLGGNHPGSKQMRWMYGGTDINSGLGILMRMFWQFKSAAVTTMDNYRRIMVSGENANPQGLLQGDISGYMQTAVLGMGMWTFQQYIKDALMGKTPEDPATAKFAMQAAAGSGMLGFVGEAYANEYRQETHYKAAGDLALNFLGPIPSAVVRGAQTTMTGLDALSSSSHTKGMDFAHEAIKNVSREIPFQNLFWFKPFFHTYLLNAAKEMTHAGYLRNLERSVEKTPGLFDKHQAYFIDALRPTAIK